MIGTKPISFPPDRTTPFARTAASVPTPRGARSVPLLFPVRTGWLSAFPKEETDMSLAFHIYHPGANAIFDVTSTLIAGETEAFLVDAQFQKQYVEELVKPLKDSGKELKVIYIFHFDSDYYFGLDVLADAFPKARILSTAQTAWMISASMEDKLAVWKKALRKDAPARFILPEAVKELPLLEGEEIRIVTCPDDEMHSFLYVPSAKTILGGVSLAEDSYPWMADTKGLDELDKWIRQVETMQALAPKQVIASHHYQDERKGNPVILSCTLEYLKYYRDALTSGNTADAIVSIMSEKYPDLEGKDTLAFGARVITGAEPWVRKGLYPGIGHHVLMDFSPAAVFDVEFKDNKTLTFTQTEGENKGYSDTMPFTAEEIADHVYMVHWQENAGIAVIHVQNWNTLEVWTNIYIPGQTGIHMKGKMIRH